MKSLSAKKKKNQNWKLLLPTSQICKKEKKNLITVPMSMLCALSGADRQRTVCPSPTLMALTAR